MGVLFLLVAVLALTVEGGNDIGLGLDMVRSAGSYARIPLTVEDAKEEDWVVSRKCTAGLGFHATPERFGRKDPVSLYFSKSGQLSGYAVDIYGDVPTDAKVDGFYKKISVPGRRMRHRLSVAFRSFDPCASKTSSKRIGDIARVMNHAGKPHWDLPLTSANATKQGYDKGACIGKMGTHYIRDTRSGGVSFDHNKMFPVIPMYDEEGLISAMLITAVDNQNKLLNNKWDIIPIPNFLMCKNFCDTSCAWPSHEWRVWSTMHVYFRDDVKTLTCPNGSCPDGKK